MMIHTPMVIRQMDPILDMTFCRLASCRRPPTGPAMEAGQERRGGQAGRQAGMGPGQ